MARRGCSWVVPGGHLREAGSCGEAGGPKASARGLRPGRRPALFPRPRPPRSDEPRARAPSPERGSRSPSRGPVHFCPRVPCQAALPAASFPWLVSERTSHQVSEGPWGLPGTAMLLLSSPLPGLGSESDNRPDALDTPRRPGPRAARAGRARVRPCLQRGLQGEGGTAWIRAGHPADARLPTARPSPAGTGPDRACRRPRATPPASVGSASAHGGPRSDKASFAKSRRGSGLPAPDLRGRGMIP